MIDTDSDYIYLGLKAFPEIMLLSSAGSRVLPAVWNPFPRDSKSRSLAAASSELRPRRGEEEETVEICRIGLKFR